MIMTSSAKESIFLCLLCVAIAALAGSASGRRYIPKPKSCDSSETWFRHRRRFVYNYVAVVEAGFGGTTDVTTGSRLSCTVTVNVPKRCEVTVQFSNCQLEERGLDGRRSLSPKSNELAKLLQKDEVYAQMNKGVVMLDGQLAVNEEEPVYITNIKRAVLSQLQLPILPWKQYEEPVQLHDQFGDCTAHVKLDGASKSLWTRRDVSQCSLPNVIGSQLHVTSFVKEFQLLVLQRPVREIIYPFESKLECQYKLVNNRIHKSTCHHGQAFKPITFDGQLTATAAFNVTQTLSLDSKASRKLTRKESIVNRFLNGRKLVDLMMQLELDPPQDVTSSGLLQSLDEIMASALGPKADDNMAPVKFQSFVEEARNAGSETLGEVLEAVLGCREPDGGCVLREPSSGQVDASLRQKHRESFFTDGLLSCGTEACVANYLNSVQRGVVSLLETELSLMNMAMFYHPAPDVISNMLELCQSSKTYSRSNCWLSLGTLTGRLAQDLRQQQHPGLAASSEEGRAAITRVIRHYAGMLGDACVPGKGLVRYPSMAQQFQQKVPQASALLALKSLANAGAAVSSMDGDDADVMTSVLQCVTNADLPDSVSTAALTVLTKADLNSVVNKTLTTVLSDASRPVALRTMAFDHLLSDRDVKTVRHLADVIDKEKLASLRTYMVTRVGHLLESNLPQEYSLRSLWRSALESRPLPVLEQLKGRGSEYAELSRYVELPFSKDQLGARLGLGVVFQPSSIVPSRLRTSLSFLLFNHSLDLMEIAVDVQGFENVIREFMRAGGTLNPPDGFGAMVARLMQAMLPKDGQVPSLFFQDPQIVKALKDMLQQVNFPTGDSVQAQFHVKMFGNEVGYVDVQDVIRMVRGQPPMGAAPKARGATLAQRLSQGLHYLVAKSSKMLEVTRMFPTVAGLPWKANVKAAMVSSGTLNVTGTVAQFLGRQGPLDLSGSVGARVGVRVTCESSVVLGDLTSSGLGLDVSVLVNHAISGRSRFAPSPGTQRLELGHTVTRQPSSLVSFRSDIFKLHNGQQGLISTPRTQQPLDQCVSDFVQKWTGQKLCLKGHYQLVPFTAHTPLPFVSGPVRLDVTADVVDKALKEYTATFLLTQSKEPSPLIAFNASFMGQGVSMKRNMEITLTVDPATKAVQGRAQVPEFDLQYALDFNSTFGSQKESNQHFLSSVLTVGPRVLHSVIFESQDLKMQQQLPAAKADDAGGRAPAADDKQPALPPVTAMLYRINMSMPGLSVEVLTNSTANKQPGFFSQELSLRYFCEPQLGILYALHGKPALAAAKGHVSVWSFSNRARFQNTRDWEASDTMAVFVPGYNVTITNTITANRTHAFRATKMYWTSGLDTPNVTTDFITMDAEVRNNSVGRQQNFHYVMLLDHQNKYDVKVDGSLVGPLSNLTFETDIVYTAKRHSRQRRSLRSISNRLKRMEKGVEEALESVEEMVVKRGAQLTESFLRWLAGEPEPGQSTEAPPTTPSPRGAAGEDGVNTTQMVPDANDRLNLGSLLQIFARPSWKLDIDANLKIKPKMAKESPKPLGYGLEWDLHVAVPHLQKDLVIFNGTLDKAKRYDGSMDWRLHSDVLNFTLTYFLEQRVAYPQVYHSHRWKLVEFTKHRYDRSFAFLVDLERHDHLEYRLDLVSPRTNLSHNINFATLSPTQRVMRSNLTLHNEKPAFDVRYSERTDLTDKGLTTDVSLNSTWLDLAMDMDMDWSAPGTFMTTQHLKSMGKVPFLKGPSQLDVELKMNMRKVRQMPSLSVRHNSTTGHVRSVVGQLLAKDLVLFTFTSQQPKAKKAVTLLNWHIRLLEPTLLEHSLSWEKPMTDPLFQGLYRFYRGGAHTFMVFGQTVADNVYRNITDMVVPFTNHTISKIVGRLVQGQMSEVTKAGLDPRKHVPMSVKVMKGGLQTIQALQLSWQNSDIGRLVYNLGAHKALSTAAWLSTRLHYMVVQDPPFPLRQYVTFHIMPVVRAARTFSQFNFTVPLPFVWEQYMSRPQPRLWVRQRDRRLRIYSSPRAKAAFPYMAILSRDRVQTFDGLNYNIDVPADESQCAYLLGADAAVKNESLLLTRASASLVLRQSLVSLATNGSVLVREGDDHTLSHVPAELVTDHTKVTLTNGQLQVSVDSQLRMTYDPESQVYVVELAWHLHNRSLGLLGTPTRDLGDDLRLPSGQLLDDPGRFQEQYELSAGAACRNKPVKQDAPAACDDRHSQLCRQLFDHDPVSPLSPCFPHVDPAQFLELCLARTCGGVRHNPANACPVVSTYLRMCATRGQHVTPDTPDFLAACDECSSSGGRQAVDMVLCPALRSADRSPEETRTVMQNLVTNMPRDARFGLVHSPLQHAHAHLFDGQLFVSAEVLQKKVGHFNLTVSEQAGHSPSIEEVLEAASNYPFRAGAKRFAVLFTGPNTPEMENVTALKLQQQLVERGISLIHVSAHLDPQHVLSASWDGKIKCLGCSKNGFSLAVTETGKLTEETRGMYMSFDVMKKARSVRMRRLLQIFKHVLKQPSPSCAEKASGA